MIYISVMTPVVLIDFPDWGVNIITHGFVLTSGNHFFSLRLPDIVRDATNRVLLVLQRRLLDSTTPPCIRPELVVKSRYLTTYDCVHCYTELIVYYIELILK